jgi:adenylate cyclase class 2
LRALNPDLGQYAGFRLQCPQVPISFLHGGRLVSVEIEVKLLVRDLAEARQRINALEPVLLFPRQFEDNCLLDFPDGRIRSRSCMIRIRTAGENSKLTFKGPARPTGVFKVREEVETPIGDSGTALEIMGKIGLQIWFRYQKYREMYAVRSPGASREEAHISVDETPVGNYIEIEGSEQAIREIAGALGFKESEFLRDSYFGLYLKYCHDCDIKPGHMVFAAGQELTDLPARKG